MEAAARRFVDGTCHTGLGSRTKSLMSYYYRFHTSFVEKFGERRGTEGDVALRRFGSRNFKSGFETV
jgi:hypothetical protein